MSVSEQVAIAARCPKCDAEIRDGSVFCYNCGGRVVESTTTEAPPSPETQIETVTKPAPGLRSARDIRRCERSFDRKPKEVVWEPTATTPDLQLIVITVGVIVFTTVVVLMVLYLR